MKMFSSSLKNKLRFFVLSLVVFLITNPAFADESLISSIIISKAKNKLNAYELNIDSTSPVNYKMYKHDDNNVYFDLKNSVISENAGTIYDDVSNIDSVTVKQLDRNKVRIYIQGKNVENTELVFINSLFETTKNPSKKVFINAPINQYKSTSGHDDLEDEDNFSAWDENSFNMSHLIGAIFTNLKDGAGGLVLILFSLLTLIALIAKNLTAHLKNENELVIGLNGKTRYQKTKNYVEQEELSPLTDRNATLQLAQQELSKAHQKYQQYLKNKYGNSTPTIKNENTALENIKKGIALNQYQKSLKNPYQNQEVIKLNEMNNYSTIDTTKGNYQIPPRANNFQTQELKNSYIQKNANLLNEKIAPKKTMQNIKFLESVTKIYEESGREDLANGLKNSISKAKQTI